MAFASFSISNLFSVKGKTCIVTGGGSGLGKGFAQALAVNGAKVVICGRREDVLIETAEELNKACQEHGSGGEVIPIRADVKDKKGVMEFFDKASQVIDKLDLLVNNAGFSPNWRDLSPMGNVETLPAKLLSIEDSDWCEMTLIHAASPFYLAVKCIPLFQKSDNPCVCNITSVASTYLNMACCEFSYAQSKASETQMTRLMAAVLKPYKIRVNAVKPGVFPSALTCFPGTDTIIPPGQDAIDNQIPLNRAGTWEEVAGIVMMMISPAGSYLNGVEIDVDGGWQLCTSARDV